MTPAELREAVAAGYDGPVQEGVAGSCNVVRYNGDDIVGVALVPSHHRRKLIVAAVNALPALLDVAEAAKVAMEALDAKRSAVRADPVLGKSAIDAEKQLRTALVKLGAL